MGNFRFLLLAIIFPFVFLGCSGDTKTLKISTKKVDFQQVPIGNMESKFVTLTNKYGKDINITTITLSNTTDYQIIGGSTPIFLTNNQTHDLEIEFEPTTAGVINALITIKHDLSDKPKEIELIGEGIPVPRIQLSEKSYDFGIIYVSVNATHDFIVTNIGSKELSVNNIALVGTGSNLYSIVSGDAPFTVPAGTTHTFTLQFSPLADGTFPISMEISHDAINENMPMSIPIDAKGVTFAPEIKFSETTPWDIGQHSTGAPSTHDLVITSVGVDPLTVSAATFASSTTFTVAEFQDNGGNIVNLPKTLQPSETLTIKIQFAPTANQKYNDILTINHDGINENNVYDFNIEGEGRVPIIKKFSFTGGIENWNVPAGVNKLTIEVWGAQGARSGGKGAYMKGDFVVTPGETLKILVGQMGKDGDNGYTYQGGGGGGGSYVCKSNNDPMIIAGGGGGKTSTGATTTMDGRHTTDGGDTYNNGGGTNGNGGDDGQTNAPAAGGGGLLTDGQTYSTSYATPGKSFLNGGAGGTGGGYGIGGGAGGFGGGGGGYTNYYNRSGGGGGYSGGQGGTWSGQYSGGGGGSINNGTNQTNQSGIKTNDGEIIITY